MEVDCPQWITADRVQHEGQCSMAMTSHEVVRRSIEFETPDRLPLRFELLGLSDVHEVC
jgi:hypothetical protein